MADESTTPDLVELTRQTYEAASRGDLDALASLYAPNVLYAAVIWSKSRANTSPQLIG
jgi:ketosteroid isomerase-like protein